LPQICSLRRRKKRQASPSFHSNKLVEVYHQLHGLLLLLLLLEKARPNSVGFILREEEANQEGEKTQDKGLEDRE
jgi:hypothetical protein